MPSPGLDEPTDLPPPYVEDDDYDVYLFYPSVSSRLLFPVNGTSDITNETTCSLKTFQQHDATLPPYRTSNPERTVDELDVPVDLPSPLSPTWSIVSDFYLHEGVAEDVMNVAGYSRVFRDGLFSKVRGVITLVDASWQMLKFEHQSRQLTSRLGLGRKFKQVLRFLKLRLGGEVDTNVHP